MVFMIKYIIKINKISENLQTDAPSVVSDKTSLKLILKLYSFFLTRSFKTSAEQLP